MTTWAVGSGDARHRALAEALERHGLWAHLTPERRAAAAADVAQGAYPFDFDLLFEEIEYFADGEDLAEHGVEEFLRELAPAVERLGVTLRVESIPAEDGEYAVAINGVHCTVIRKEEWDVADPWALATVRPLAVLNGLLESAARSPLRAHTLYTGGNDGLLLFLDPRAVEAMWASGLFPKDELPALATDTQSGAEPLSATAGGRSRPRWRLRPGSRRAARWAGRA